MTSRLAVAFPLFCGASAIGRMTSPAPSLGKELVCSDDAGYWYPASAHVCYWGEPEEDGKAYFNMAGLDVPDLLSLRSCSRAPRKRERSGQAAESYWARC